MALRLMNRLPKKEKSVINSHIFHNATRFAVSVNDNQQRRDDFDFDIVNFPFIDGDVPRSTSYGVYISQLIRFARVSSHVDDFNTRNKV